ncbi:MAG TPA: glycoside hydrolase 43 family protein, partial [Thermoclostridium sp.]|nr:glycoside hydrolase 43 family protein [Thermoclostridium sp.]
MFIEKEVKPVQFKWGDLGNGFYKNPILNADYSDPDVVRVGDDFYMVCSEFHYMGIPVLHSKDLVNWTIIGRVYDSLKHDPVYDTMNAYAKGSWAPAIKYHNGTFYIYFCTPDEGLYMSSAINPAGPWAPIYEVERVAGWEDPCPFWDDDGNAYLGHSTVGAGPIIIHKMSADGTKLLDNGTIVYVGKIAEGTKIYKRNGYYYFVIPEGGVKT